jgi:hypothetical protein
MWVEGAVGGKADLGDWNPEAAKGGGAYTDLLCEVKICCEAPATDGGRFSFLCFIIYYHCFYTTISFFPSSSFLKIFI